MTAIAVNGVTVRYGRRVAVDGVTLAVSRGAVYALLGRNGAGKSSLVRCILGEQQPEAGSVTLLGADVWRHRAELMARVGVVSEEADAPSTMRVSSLAKFSASLYPRWDKAAFDERLARFGIAQNTRFGDLSKGQKKQVSVALALGHGPELLILDDPTLGLDVVARKSLFEEVIADLADRGTTVLITTHDLAGVEGIADRVGVLAGGKLLLDEELDALKSRFRRVRYARRPMTMGNLATVATRAWGSGAEVVVTNYEESSFTGDDVAEVAPMSLEEIFIAVTDAEGGVQ